jgi:RNA polymerase sigma-70 factor (ECF subfamily)
MENYEDIVRKYYNRYQSEFIRKLTAQYPMLTLFDAENLYQEAFLAIHENLQEGRIRENTSWGSYIMTIGLNLANKEMRQLGRTDSIDGDDDDDNSTSYATRSAESILTTLPEEETPLYQDQQAQSLLGEELAHTPEPCSSIIRLYYYEKLSMDEIAHEMNYRNSNTVKTIKSQCMKDLIKRVKNSLHNAGITA